jgi:GNAT superfamily N-acetyltransferase
VAGIVVREAPPGDWPALGALTVDAYLRLEGMPSLEAGREYYDDLRDVATRAARDHHLILTAYDGESGALLGGATFILEAYGALWGIENSAGVRMLAVAPSVQARGVGRAVMADCLARARAAGKTTLVLHTTPAMQTAQRMYARLGFVREPAMDFDYVGMTVMGYRLALER